MIPPGLLIAAPRSGAGKTTISLGIMRALSRSGVAVAPVKCGPDYIDPAFHAAACGRAGVNLDSWAMDDGQRAALAAQALTGADLAVGEALMGLFDGVPGPAGRTGSSADIAASLGWPVVLVLDVSGQSQSAAAAALGFKLYDPRLTVAGVILNRLGSPRHERLIRAAMASLDLPVLGAVPRSAKVELPERHLGLIQAGETADLAEKLDALADLAEAHLDLAALRALAAPTQRVETAAARPLPPPGQRIALARDAAFSFVYPHLLMQWRAAGAELLPFSPLADEPPPPDADCVWLPGGYPELHAGHLAQNETFLTGLRRAADSIPVHGECGGYMVLGESLTDADGIAHPMAGLLGLATSFATRRMSLGYRQATLLADGLLGAAGTLLRGHEFHYATILTLGGDAPFAETTDAYGAPPTPTGSRRGRVSGSFFHAIAPA